MKALPVICFIFILVLMGENGTQRREIRTLKSDVESLQEDVRGAYEALNNIQNSATNILVFDNTYESD